MSRDQPESFKIQADIFDSWLLDASETDFEEFIEKASTWLREFAPELLHECKSRVDARLAAEPDTKVFTLSDPPIVRQRYWHTVADRLQAEINIRSLSSGTSTSRNPALNLVRPGAKQDPGVASRRVIVRQNNDLSDKDLCELLDRQAIGVPIDWLDKGAKTWVEAWRTRKRQIHVIFSKDRRSR